MLDEIGNVGGREGSVPYNEDSLTSRSQSRIDVLEGERGLQVTVTRLPLDLQLQNQSAGFSRDQRARSAASAFLSGWESPQEQQPESSNQFGRKCRHRLDLPQALPGLSEAR